MRLSIYITVLIVQLISFVHGLGFSGKFKDIPDEIDELFKTRNAKVLNGDNYQSKFNVQLYPLNTDKFDSLSSPVYRDYSFEFNGLKVGEYELVVSSYDFFFESDRFRIIIDDYEEIVAIKDSLTSSSLNRTSGVVISPSNPLEIQFRQIKQFYEYSGGTISEMLLSSPLGFIFKNQTYTMLFIVAIGLMIAPTALQYISPELHEQYNPSTLAAEQATKLQQAEKIRRIQQQQQQQQQTIKTQPVPNKADPSNSDVRKRR
ncbi:hypothetical protein DFJ63DRAFT_143434 [Scheffersomyces coipomensis]|uniref:uncharacterized protein n=1 Tax=Scheffersomyces coipomensis TaxID=1788519 RepID=UPI00315D6C9F